MPKNQIIAELTSAKISISSMRGAASFQEYERHWKYFLIDVDTAWKKCINAYSRSGSTELIRSRVNRDRKSDPLISFMLHARNSNAHSVREILQHHPGGVGIGAGPSGSVHIKTMRIDGSGNIANLDFTGSLLVTKISPKTEVIAVEDSGTLYQPPTEHLGQTVRSRDPVVLAEMTFAFYEKNIEELLEKLEKPSSP